MVDYVPITETGDTSRLSAHVNIIQYSITIMIRRYHYIVHCAHQSRASQHNHLDTKDSGARIWMGLALSWLSLAANARRVVGIEGVLKTSTLSSLFSF